MQFTNKYTFLKRFSVESLYNTFLGLQPKEQIIAMVVSGALLLLIIFMPISLAGGKISQMEKAINQNREQMGDVVRNIDEYNKEKAKLSAIESLMKSGFDTSLSSTIEGIATQTGVKPNVDQLKEKPLIPSEVFDEAGVDVRVSKVTLQQLVDFLYKIEGEKSKVLRVKQIQIKPRYDNRTLVDANFVVSTFKLSGEGA